MEKTKMKKKNKAIIVIAVILIVAIAAGLLYVLFGKDDAVKVELVTSSKQTVNQTLDTTGTLASDSEQVFSLPDGVKVVSVNVKEGENVGAGQVIATFDTQSLQDSVNIKEEEYEKASAAYNQAKKKAGVADGKIDEVKKQIAELEAKIAKYKSNSQTTAKTTQAQTGASSANSGVEVSDSLVKRFVRVAKLFGVEYTNDEAKKVLTNVLSAGNSLSDINKVMDQLGTISSMQNFDMSKMNFDMSALTSMSSMGTEALQAELTLSQLKAQLTTLEIQSNEAYLNTYKLVAEKAREAYAQAKDNVERLKDGWKSESSGVVSEVNIQEGSTSVAAKDSATGNSVDISSILSAVSSGSDVTSMVSSFFGKRATAVKILNYPLIANIALSKYDVSEVTLNQPATIKSATGEIFDGNVSYISATASSSGGIDIGSIMGGNTSSGTTIPAQVTIHSASRSLIVGVDVEISIITDTVENAVVVPVEAICIDGSDTFVYAYDKEKGRAVKTPVTLGISNDTYYQVKSGVSEGDVLIKNTSGLKDDVKVSVTEK